MSLSNNRRLNLSKKLSKLESSLSVLLYNTEIIYYLKKKTNDYHRSVTKRYDPIQSLKEGNWFKLICGASFQHLPAIRSLALAYTLAGADCIDVAADPAVIRTAKAGIAAAHKLTAVARKKGFTKQGSPLLMVSLNDGEDPHFRKAEFVPSSCPTDCSRPCEQICPVEAISWSGVVEQLCYGCGRCLPVCPSESIYTRSYVYTPEAIISLIETMGIEAIEIHTQVGHGQEFQQLWQKLAPWVGKLKLLAISCGDHPDLINYLQSIHDLIYPLPCPLIWQTDGRPMSGDIGIGATRAAVKLAEKVLAAKLPGYVQLAGGTNQHTVTKLQISGLLPHKSHQSGNLVAGVAYGSYARSLLAPILEQLETSQELISVLLEDNPTLLWQGVQQAHSLVSQLKLATHTLAFSATN